MKYTVFACALACHGTVAYSQSIDGSLSPKEENIFSSIGGSVTFGLSNMRQSGEFNVTGPSFGLGYAGKFEFDNYSPLYMEYSGTWAWGNSESSSSVVQGAEAFVYTSRVSPNGSIDLSTDIDGAGASADGTAEITDGTGGSASIISSAYSPAGEGNAVSQFATSLTETGGVFTALTTNGEDLTAATFGGIFDENGFSFVGTAGEDSSSTITTTVEDNVKSIDQTLYFGNRRKIDDNWTLATKVGPTYRSFGRNTTRRTTIKIDRSFDDATPIPEVSIDDNWSLSGKYLGALVGAGLSRGISERWSVNLGADFGLAKLKAKSHTSEVVNFAGNSASIHGLSKSLNGTSQIGRLTGGLTHISKSGAIINFGGYVDYMSDVPYLQFESENTPDVTTSGSSVGLTGGGETYRTHSIQKKQMVSSGLTFSIVYLF